MTKSNLPGPKAQAMIERDHKVISPSYPRGYPFVMDHGKGSEVWDVDGNRFLDFMGGIAVVSTGYLHPKVVKAMQGQVEKFIHISSDFYHENWIKLGEKLNEIAPFKEDALTFMTNSGTEADETAIKLARDKERISRLYQMHANKQNPIDRVEAGDIAAAVGFKDIKTGDTLCDLEKPIVLESMVFPEPVIAIAVEPKYQKETDKLGMALTKLAEEDPTFRVRYDDETNQTVISGMGELHLEIIVDRLKREFKVECNQGAPEVNYKEALTKKVDHRERLKKQTGGAGLFTDIAFELGPADQEFLDSEDFKSGKVRMQFVNNIVGGSIPRELIAPTTKGFNACMDNGPLAGFTMDSMKVRIYDGSTHAVDSKPIAFELCAKEGFREAAKSAGPVLLEPIMKLEVVCPDEYVGSVIGDLNRRRGLPKGQEVGRVAQ